MLKHKGQNILVIDLEFAQTYKKKLKKAAIMEIGLVYVKNLMLSTEKVTKYSKFFNPGVKVSHYATKVTGITNKMIKGFKPIEESHFEIQPFIDKADILVFHGGGPDKMALINSGFNISNKVIIDTQDLAENSKENFESYSLENIAKSLNINSNGTHRALNDALITLELYKKLALKNNKYFELDKKAYF